MSDLFEKSMRTLELPAVLEMLAQRAVSDEAKERCRRLRPSTEAETVSHLLDETDAAKTRLGLHGSPSFTGVKDVAQPLNRADHGGMLNTRELLDIAGELGFRVCLVTNGTLLPRQLPTLEGSPALHKLSVSLHSFEGNDCPGSMEEYLSGVWDFCRLASAEGTLCADRKSVV